MKILLKKENKHNKLNYGRNPVLEKSENPYISTGQITRGLSLPYPTTLQED
jgi:hypothetical protein